MLSGRFLQRDPIGRQGGLNDYVYVGDNPVLRIDPSGLAASEVGPSADRAASDPNNYLREVLTLSLPGVPLSQAMHHWAMIAYKIFLPDLDLSVPDTDAAAIYLMPCQICVENVAVHQRDAGHLFGFVTTLYPNDVFLPEVFEPPRDGHVYLDPVYPARIAHELQHIVDIRRKGPVRYQQEYDAYARGGRSLPPEARYQHYRANPDEQKAFAVQSKVFDFLGDLIQIHVLGKRPTLFEYDNALRSSSASPSR